MLYRVSCLFLGLGFFAVALYAQPSYDFELVDFKTVGNDTLRLHVFEPPEDDADKLRPAIVFFFGGGWVSGSPKQFYPHADYFASRGMVAIAAEYRIKNKHDTTPFESVADGKSAIRWVRANAERLNIDPDKIVAAGGSAGGHVAACTGVIEGREDGADDLSIGSQPVAMILFNPVLDLQPEKWHDRFKGLDPMPLSPIHQVEAEHPPTLIFHGTTDDTVPIVDAQRFCTAMTNTGSSCRLMSFQDMGHGFFNYGRHGNKPFVETVLAADQFMIELGILDGPPTIK
ncbi:MAG: alpha/beta hydrolase [Rhodothermales bacterium]